MIYLGVFLIGGVFTGGLYLAYLSIAEMFVQRSAAGLIIPLLGGIGLIALSSGVLKYLWKDLAKWVRGE